MRFEGDSPLAGRVAVVTGAGSGLGAAMARRFAAAGMRVALADIEQGPLDETASSIAGEGTEVLVRAVDVRDGAALEALADAVFNTWGSVHVLCNNAGVATGGRAWELSVSDWQWVLGVDLWGVINGLRAFVPRMIERGEPGHVVNTGSMTSLLAVPNLAAYGAAKAAVASLSEALALDLAAEGANIGVSVLCPGHIDTAIGDSARNRPADVAAVAPARPRRRTTEGVTSRMTVDEVAEHVLAAIVDDQFWILTHEEYRPLLVERAEGIGGGGRPSPPPIW